jgi:hypothetical protein
MTEDIKTAGRPKGAKTNPNKTAKLLDRLANSRGETIVKIIDTVTKMAEGGERWAVEALFTRLWPAPKGRTVKLDLPVGVGIDGIAAAFDRIMRRSMPAISRPRKGWIARHCSRSKRPFWDRGT